MTYGPPPDRPDPHRAANSFVASFAGCLGVAAAIILALVVFLFLASLSH